MGVPVTAPEAADSPSLAIAFSPPAERGDNVVLRILRGDRLQHPLHPLLTDLPIGFWTSANVLDLAGGEIGAPVADAFVLMGTLAVVPTALTGWADRGTLDGPGRRRALVHAALNGSATAAYATSWVLRRRGDRRAGVALALLGAGLATIGGYLGGHLAFVDRPRSRVTPEGGAPSVWSGPADPPPS